MSLFDDIVFAHRNKSYGAYQLRKRYTRHLLLAIVITAFFSTCLILFALFDVAFRGSDSIYKIMSDSTGIIEFANYDLAPIPVEPQKNPRVTGINESSVEVAKVTSDEFGFEDERTEQMMEEMMKVFQDDLTEELNSDIENSTAQDVHYNRNEMNDMNGAIKFRETELRRYILNNTRYPDSAMHKKINGLVLVQFLLSNKGEITNISILKQANPILDREALRVVKSIPRSNPVLVKGKPVTVLYKIPIVFKYNQ